MHVSNKTMQAQIDRSLTICANISKIVRSLEYVRSLKYAKQ